MNCSRQKPLLPSATSTTPAAAVLLLLLLRGCAAASACRPARLCAIRLLTLAIDLPHIDTLVVVAQ